jgi:2-methylisocitrate lyase-like PEP mutase family enzyme
MKLSTDHQADRARVLRRLHQEAALLELVNVWDVASAREVARLPGCTAIATASAAIAASHGYEDGEKIPFDLHVHMLGRICAAVDLPVTVDLERGYGDVPATVGAAIDVGAVGVNLEDDMCPIDEMSERIRDAVRAGRTRNVPIVVNARTDVYLKASETDEAPDLIEATARGRAYLEAGADCVFVPGCIRRSDIQALVAALGRGKVSLLGFPGTPDVSELEALGVARLSHGPFPQRHALRSLATYRHTTEPPR